MVRCQNCVMPHSPENIPNVWRALVREGHVESRAETGIKTSWDTVLYRSDHTREPSQHAQFSNVRYAVNVGAWA